MALCFRINILATRSATHSFVKCFDYYYCTIRTSHCAVTAVIVLQLTIIVHYCLGVLLFGRANHPHIGGSVLYTLQSYDMGLIRQRRTTQPHKAAS
ncbi:hypothetical protein LZ31DRAFT_250730 [Colletotrichum somersetense]|nr:hypothetical protein LZ31DRAFT_250730 [Colletotrichum somersetense]